MTALDFPNDTSDHSTMVASRTFSLAWNAFRRIIIPLAGIAALGVVIAWMSGAFHEKVPPGQIGLERRTASGEQTAEVTTLETEEKVDAVGTVQASTKTDVASQIVAAILNIHVRPGDAVMKGELIATLDDREIQAQLREAEAALAAAEADLAVRQREYARYQQMMAAKAVTKEAFDQVEGAYRVATAQVERARAQVNRIKVTLSYTQITAPREGIVADRYMDPGDLAVPGKPLLTIHNPHDLELHANVREGLMDKVRVGMTLPVRIDALHRTVTGTIREIVPQAEATSRSVLVKVVLPVKELEGVYLGMFGRISIPVGRVTRTVVDSRAVRRVGQLELVDVVRDDGTVQRRFVRTGMLIGNQVEVLAGLEPGERVLVGAPGSPQEASRRGRDRRRLYSLVTADEP